MNILEVEKNIIYTLLKKKCYALCDFENYLILVYLQKI